MPSEVALYGYSFSVYAWIARLVLQEKGVPYKWVEIDPFSDDVPAAYIDMNPFCRVPTLKISNFEVYETVAITRFVDENFEGPALQPDSAVDRARVAQLISILDSYGYWPMVRQVFSHGYYLQREGERADLDEVARGLESSARVLSAIEQLLDDTQRYAVGTSVTLADLHLAPMISYFCEVPKAAAMLRRYAGLKQWWAVMQERSAFVETRPDFGEIGRS